MFMKLKVALFGHSYIRDLKSLGETNICDLGDAEFSLKYFSYPGATFSTFINGQRNFDALKVYQPHYIIVILGGNDLKVSVQLSDIYKECTDVYRILRETLSQAIIIASQIENRFYEPDNGFGSPAAKTFDFLRRHFNHFLKNKAFKDFLLQVQGPNRLDKKENYRDAVHLSPLGLRKYFAIIRCTLSYAYRNKQPLKSS